MAYPQYSDFIGGKKYLFVVYPIANIIPLYILSWERVFGRYQFEKNIKKYFTLTSIPIFRILILCPGLRVMALFTQSLPVAPIPKQLLVTAVRNDVVNDRSFGVLTLHHTLDAQRMGFEVLLAGLLPFGTVSSGCCRRTILHVEGLVLPTVFPV